MISSSKCEQLLEADKCLEEIANGQLPWCLIVLACIQTKLWFFYTIRNSVNFLVQDFHSSYSFCLVITGVYDIPVAGVSLASRLCYEVMLYAS